MLRSTKRLLTTHTRSLLRPPGLRGESGAVERSALSAVVHEVMTRQAGRGQRRLRPEDEQPPAAMARPAMRAARSARARHRLIV